MNCELCHTSPEVVYLLPIKQADGKLNTIACVDCSRNSEHYCLSHDIPHLGFGDNTSACIKCVEKEVDLIGTQVAVEFVDYLSSSLNKGKVKEVVKEYINLFFLSDRAFTDYIPDLNREYYKAQASAIARPIICYKMRSRKNYKDTFRYTSNYPRHVFLGEHPLDA